MVLLFCLAIISVALWFSPILGLALGVGILLGLAALG